MSEEVKKPQILLLDSRRLTPQLTQALKEFDGNVDMVVCGPGLGVPELIAGIKLDASKIPRLLEVDGEEGLLVDNLDDVDLDDATKDAIEQARLQQSETADVGTLSQRVEHALRDIRFDLCDPLAYEGINNLSRSVLPRGNRPANGHRTSFKPEGKGRKR